jgi:hypothetical protein
MPFIADRALGWPPASIDSTWCLRDIPKGYAMTICNSLFCTDCSVCFLDIRFNDIQLHRLYSDYRGTAYASLREKYEPGYLDINSTLKGGLQYSELVEAFISPLVRRPVRLLDWGGDSGMNSPFQSESAIWDIFDISDVQPREGARKITEEQAREGDYSLVVCSQVLEHVPYPVDILRRIKRCMSPSTILYIEVPHEAVVASKANLPKAKKHWHEHINFFSRRSLEKLAENAGFRVVKFKDDGRVRIGQREALIFQMALKTP